MDNNNDRAGQGFLHQILDGNQGGIGQVLQAVLGGFMNPPHPEETRNDQAGSQEVTPEETAAEQGSAQQDNNGNVHLEPIDVEDEPQVSRSPSESTVGPSSRAAEVDSEEEMPGLQSVSDSSDEDRDVDMYDEWQEPLDVPLPESPQPPQTYTNTRNARRARVEDDEDESRETNRQRRHSPTPDHEPHVHVDQADQPPNTNNAPDAGFPRGTPLVSRIVYSVDIITPTAHPGAPNGEQPQQPQENLAGAPPGGPRGNTRTYVFDFPLADVFAPQPPETPGAAPQAPPTGGQGGQPANHIERMLLQLLRQRMAEGGGMFFPLGMDMFDEPQEDPERAKKLVSGLEQVPVGLVQRMERVGGPGTEEGDAPGCAVCWDKLLEPESEIFEDKEKFEAKEGDGDGEGDEGNAEASSSSRASTPRSEPQYPKIVSLPCSHVFHASCLLPWFTQPHRTTCPTCRFDLDPDSLTYTPPPPRPRRARAQQQQQQQQQPAGADAGARQAAPPMPADDDAEQQAGGEHQDEAGPAPDMHGFPPNMPMDGGYAFAIDFRMFPAPPPRAPGDGAGAAPTQGQPFGPQAGTDIPMFMDAGFAPGGGMPVGNFPDMMAAMGMAPPTGGPDAGVAQHPADQTHPEDHRTTPNPATQAMPGTGPAPQQQQQQHGGLPHGVFAGDDVDRMMGAFLRMMFPGMPVHPAPRGAPQPGVGAQPAGAQPAPNADVNTNVPPNPNANHGANANAGGFTFQPLHFHPVPPFAPIPHQHAHPHPHVHPPHPHPHAHPHPHPHAHVHTHAPGMPPLTMPMPMPMPNQGRRGTRQPPAEKRPWTLPAAPGPSLRERIERKEREIGLRCNDVSCGLGPSDEDPFPDLDARVVRQVGIHLLSRKEGEEAQVCEHKFHPACLVSAERVAGWGGVDEKEKEEVEAEVEVSCPVCRAVGGVSKVDWDEGACALA